MADALRTSPAREDLCRSAPFTLTRATEVDDGLTIEGYGAVFNSPTRISGWEGDFDEVITPGAFKKSLNDQRAADGTSRLRMQFDHGQHPLLGSLPLGRWTVAEEDERGLHLVGRLTDNWLTTPFRDAIRDGGVAGMSFRFAVVKEEWADNAGVRLRDAEVPDLLYRPGTRGPIVRTLRAVKVSEAGPVVWPAYEDTAVGVRARGTVVIDLARLREPAQRRQLAEVVALVEAATRDADQQNKNTLTDLVGAGYTPDSALAFVNRGGIDELKHTGNFSVQLQPSRDTEPTPVEATPPPEVPAGSPNVEQQIVIENDQSEPQTTAPSADNHPAEQAAPEVTDRAAGEHSAPTRPVNPVERRELIRKEFRAVTNRVLALPRHQTPKENSA